MNNQAAPAPESAAASVRLIDLEKDYPMFDAWWKHHGVISPPRAILPDAGLLVSSHGEPALAAWLYQDNTTGVAFLGWFVANPDGAPITTSRCVQTLLTAVDEFCRSQQRHTIFCMSGNRILGKRMLRHGYVAAHTATEYCRVVPAEKGTQP